MAVAEYLTTATLVGERSARHRSAEARLIVDGNGTSADASAAANATTMSTRCLDRAQSRAIPSLRTLRLGLAIKATERGGRRASHTEEAYQPIH